MFVENYIIFTINILHLEVPLNEFIERLQRRGSVKNQIKEQYSHGSCLQEKIDLVRASIVEVSNISFSRRPQEGELIAITT